MTNITQYSFNARQIEPIDRSFDALPPGWYDAIVQEAVIKQNSAKSGYFLEIRYGITQGLFKGSVIIDRLNIVHSNEVTQRIALGELSALSHAVNVLDWSDTRQLQNIPLKIKLKVTPASDKYDPGNQVTSWKPANYQVPGQIPTPNSAASFAIPPNYVTPEQSFAPIQASQPDQYPQFVPGATQPNRHGFTMPDTINPGSGFPPQLAPGASIPHQVPSTSIQQGQQPQPQGQQPQPAWTQNVNPAETLNQPSNQPPAPPHWGQGQPTQPTPKQEAKPKADVPPWLASK